MSSEMFAITPFAEYVVTWIVPGFNRQRHPLSDGGTHICPGRAGPAGHTADKGE